MIPKKVFVSWQSGNKAADKKFRGAINKIEKEFKHIEMTQATHGVSGAPSILEEIYKKIDTCDVFMCDLSIEFVDGDRYYPNSNVLYELGYAIKTLGEYNCIIFFDNSQHDITSLPFDTNHMRMSLITDKVNFYKDMAKYIDNCIPKYITMNLTNMLNRHIENISWAPNNVVTEKYVDELNNNIKKYINVINNEDEKKELNHYFQQLCNFRGVEMGVPVYNPKASKEIIDRDRYNANMKIIEYSRNIHMNIGSHVHKMLCKIFDL